VSSEAPLERLCEDFVKGGDSGARFRPALGSLGKEALRPVRPPEVLNAQHRKAGT